MSEDFAKEDFERVSWEEHVENMDGMKQEIEEYLKENDLEVDAVVPILRGGNFLGTYLAYKLNVLRIMPVQYKYFFEGEEGKEIELKQLSSIDSDKLPEEPVLLLTEDNRCFGTTAGKAAENIKQKIPEATILYAADQIDYSHKENKYADEVFYGRLTNETRELSKEECRELGVETGSHLLPWENLEEEWQTVQAKQFSYQDEEEARESSSTEESMDGV